MQALMWSVLVITIDPALGFAQNISQRTRGSAFGYCELNNAYEPFCVPMVWRRACPPHRTHEAFGHERRARLLLGITLLRAATFSKGLKRCSPAMSQRAGDPKVLAPLFLRGIPLHAFQDHLAFGLWRRTLPFRVPLIPYLSLLLCLVEQGLDRGHMPF